jgi:hypothetical protein
MSSRELSVVSSDAETSVPTDVIFVEWVDPSSTDDNGWTPYDEVLSARPGLCRSVGFVLKEDEDLLWILPHLELHSEKGGGGLVVPKKLIVRRHELCRVFDEELHLPLSALFPRGTLSESDSDGDDDYSMDEDDDGDTDERGSDTDERGSDGEGYEEEEEYEGDSR